MHVKETVLHDVRQIWELHVVPSGPSQRNAANSSGKKLAEMEEHKVKELCQLIKWKFGAVG